MADFVQEQQYGLAVLLCDPGALACEIAEFAAQTLPAQSIGFRGSAMVFIKRFRVVKSECAYCGISVDFGARSLARFVDRT